MKNKVIIYDDSCPMCKWYTGEFVNTGMLDAKNRLGFSEADTDILQNIDIERSRHEIPLYDLETKQTLYGPDALYCLLGEKMPFFKPLFRNAIFRAFITQLYQIITYNRRIIAGSSAPKIGFDCAPDFNLFYRSLYIVLATIASVLIAKNIIAYSLSYQSQGIKLMIIVISLIIFLFVLLGLFLPKRVSYWGHLATILLADNLFAGLILLITSCVGGSPIAFWASMLLGFCVFAGFITWKRKEALKEVFR